VKRAMVAYYSRTGKTEKMARYIAEGIRFSGNEAEALKISEVKSEKAFEGPTYHKDMTENFKTFLFLAQKGNLAGKVGGAFGSSTHSSEAPGAIADTMEHVFKMRMSRLGPFKLMEDKVETPEGMKACHDYGRAIGEQLSPRPAI